MQGWWRGVGACLWLSVVAMGCAAGFEPDAASMGPLLDDETEGEDEASTGTGGEDGGTDGETGEATTDGDTSGGEPGEPVCGDGLVEGDEACDLGPANDPYGECTPSCTLATCGDGLVQAAVEECDDGNGIDTDTCTNACTTATCGDGIVQQGVELCDDGNLLDADGCTSACTLASCGDGVVQAPEACDDGNASNSDDCLATCLLASCGDGFTRTGVEECDDGNGIDGDACPGTCMLAECGDGFVYTGVEECDDGNGSNEDACLTSCQGASCGDGFVYAGVEECDGGGDPTVYSCSGTCQDQLVWYQWSFFYGYVPDPMACADFVSWRNALADDHTSIHIEGTYGGGGRTCTGPQATTLCNALRTGASVTVDCDGHTWHVGDCLGALEVTADGTSCDCASPGYALRPCLNGVDWGGVGTSSCWGPNQEIYIECGFD